jgi:hypothetical protein
LGRAFRLRRRAEALISQIEKLVLDAYQLPSDSNTALTDLFAGYTRELAFKFSQEEWLFGEEELSFEALNDRRILLIHRKYTVGLTEAEEDELVRIKGTVRGVMHERYSLPS